VDRARPEAVQVPQGVLRVVELQIDAEVLLLQVRGGGRVNILAVPVE
jgi:hypothetical protein